MTGRVSQFPKNELSVSYQIVGVFPVNICCCCTLFFIPIKLTVTSLCVSILFGMKHFCYYGPSPCDRCSLVAGAI